MLTQPNSPPKNSLSRSLALALGLTTLILLLTGCASGKYAVYQNFMQPRLDGAERSKADLLRDIGNRPMEALFFFNIKPGMDVLSVRDDGYLTEILALAVGSEAQVYSHYIPITRSDSLTTVGEYKQRLEADHMANVIELNGPIDDVEIESGSLDFIVLHLSLHELLNEFGEQRAAKIFAMFRKWLKPKGSVGIIDHIGRSSATAATLRRLDAANTVPWLWELPGFQIVQSSALRNPKDDAGLSSQDVYIAGYTDRLMLRLTKKY